MPQACVNSVDLRVSEEVKCRVPRLQAWQKNQAIWGLPGGGVVELLLILIHDFTFSPTSHLVVYRASSDGVAVNATSSSLIPKSGQPCAAMARWRDHSSADKNLYPATGILPE